MNEPAGALRCAIYTRKSTEEGLEQEFNSLQAQREAAQAYIASQRQARWTALPEQYDDGGFSGASLERPALRKLLSAIQAGGIDCVVVYKVDRLSRSLLDFARLMALFEGRGIGFVSVTQEFNTTTSLGRLTLHILLSFSQFEQELIGERTRDKLGAARRKGKWTGGIPVLGYDVDPRGGRLMVNEAEAERVREIFSIGAGAGTLAAALREVQQRGFRTKEWTSKEGQHRVGHSFSESTLRRLLGNVLYKGSICHKGTVYAGEQPALVEGDLWEQVNRQLAIRSAHQQARKHAPQRRLLSGMLYCGSCGSPMAVTYTGQAGQRHSYYVCKTARQRQGCKQRPVAASDIEAALARQLEPALGDQPSEWSLQQALQRVTYDGATRAVTAVLHDNTRLGFRIEEPNRRGVRRCHPPMDTGRVPRISRLMALALKLERLRDAGQLQEYAELARVGHISRPRLSQILNLLNLAPAIQETLLFLPKTVAGPDRITEKRLRDIAQEVDWGSQQALFEKWTAQA
jgi:site-specific DNA recombinase